ncbi:MAG TPA: YihY/virulence factor BrkB family protein [Acidimicrobiales bacterium]|nr:YihY/virulence factor BrkB family protein [Acidimicrobiales bacterium]
MSTATVVPETRGLSGDDAWATLRHTGRRRLLTDAFVRMRVADGFSHARSLAFMTGLAAVQGVIALVGLAGVVGGSGFSTVVGATVRAAVPGPAGQALTAAVAHAHATGAQHRWPALVFGTIGTLVTATTAFGQLERAFNRLYGVEQDRPTVQKYGRAFVLALTAGSASALAFVSLALGKDLLVHTTSGVLSTLWNGGRWAIGTVLIGMAVTVMLRACPRRRQPKFSWLAFGAAISVGGTLLVTVALGAFFRTSTSFGQTYGPLAGTVALLLWTLCSSIVLIYGAAVAAQLEAVRAGASEPQDAEKVAESEPDAPTEPGHQPAAFRAAS